MLPWMSSPPRPRISASLEKKHLGGGGGGRGREERREGFGVRRREWRTSFAISPAPVTAVMGFCRGLSFRRYEYNNNMFAYTKRSAFIGDHVVSAACYTGHC